MCGGVGGKKIEKNTITNYLIKIRVNSKKKNYIGAAKMVQGLRV